MAKIPGPIVEQERLLERERELGGLGMEAVAAVRLAKAELQQAQKDLGLADAERLRGCPDRVAEAQERVRSKSVALESAERHQRALPEALRSLRADANGLATEHRQSVFLPHAREGIGQLQRKAGELLPLVDELLALSGEAARRIDRLRFQDLDNGAFAGPGAEPAANLQEVRAALATISEQGMLWPWSLDPETGANISARERRERQEAENLRQRGYVPKSEPIMDRL